MELSVASIKDKFKDMSSFVNHVFLSSKIPKIETSC
jgi:hypothetical protein